MLIGFSQGCGLEYQRIEEEVPITRETKSRKLSEERREGGWESEEGPGEFCHVRLRSKIHSTLELDESSTQPRPSKLDVDSDKGPESDQQSPMEQNTAPGLDEVRRRNMQRNDDFIFRKLEPYTIRERREDAKLYAMARKVEFDMDQDKYNDERQVKRLCRNGRSKYPRLVGRESGVFW